MKVKSAIVTGSTSGIGLAVATELAKQGCSIVLNGFGDAADIEAIVQDMQTQYGVFVAYHGADMSKPDEISDLISSCQSQLGSVDILVNNAGIQHTDAVDEFPAEKWDQILATNLSSNFHSAQAALPIMKAQNSGRIVNISSVHGHVASINKAAYVAAKHGVLGLTTVIALETAETPVPATRFVQVGCARLLFKSKLMHMQTVRDYPKMRLSRGCWGKSNRRSRLSCPVKLARLLFICAQTLHLKFADRPSTSMAVGSRSRIPGRGGETP